MFLLDTTYLIPCMVQIISCEKVQDHQDQSTKIDLVHHLLPLSTKFMVLNHLSLPTRPTASSHDDNTSPTARAMFPSIFLKNDHEFQLDISSHFSSGLHHFHDVQLRYESTQMNLKSLHSSIIDLTILGNLQQ